MSEVETMRLPLLALRGLIVFPGMIINLDVGRDRSIKAVETAMATTKRILLVTQKAAEEADPTAQDLYGFGVVAEIKQMLKMPNGEPFSASTFPALTTCSAASAATW